VDACSPIRPRRSGCSGSRSTIRTASDLSPRQHRPRFRAYFNCCYYLLSLSVVAYRSTALFVSQASSKSNCDRGTPPPYYLRPNTTLIISLYNPQMFKPIMTSTPTKKALILPPRQKLVYPQHPVAPPLRRAPAFFRANTIQTCQTLSPRPTIPYRGFGYGLHQPPPPVHHYPKFRLPEHEPQPPPPPPPAAQTLVSPHIAGWMGVADTVVGRHPFAQPLSARVATQAEIDLIGGHVHIPWAFRANISQPVPVKVLKPIAVSPPLSIYPVPNRNAAGAGAGSDDKESAAFTREGKVLAALAATRIKLDDPIATVRTTQPPQGKGNAPPVRVGPPGRRDHRLRTPNLI